jgi:O-antigen ligase
VSGRSAGLTTHPNHLAMISTLGAGLALALTAREEGWRRWAAAACSGVLAITVMRAGSRAGLLALVVAVGVVAMRARPVGRPKGRPGKGPLLACVLGLVVAALVAGNAVQLGQHNALRRVLGDTTSASSDQARVSLLHAGLHTIAQHPLTGTGFENVLEAHNIYVQTWAAGGILGILGFLVLAFAVVRAGLSVPARSPEGWLATGFVAGYLGYLAAGIVQNFLWDRYLWLHVAAILWLATCARSIEAPREQCA